jgi:Predicted unusual protein kinase
VLQPCEIFSDIEKEPLGAASLAQVHKATLKDGTVVAVKVQHPYVRGNALVDMKTMEVMSVCLVPVVLGELLIDPSCVCLCQYSRD